MTPPPWNPQTEAEVIAFKEFVTDELDRLNVAMHTGPEGKRGMQLLSDIVREGQLRRELLELGVPVPPAKRKRGGHRGPRLPLTPSTLLAIRDVERMRAIFRQHWGKVNRHHRPTREDIAAEFHNLSAEEKRELEEHFAKQPKGSDARKS